VAAEVEDFTNDTGLWICGQCGLPVTGKEIIHGESGGDPHRGIVWRTSDRLGPNQPCGHDAPAFRFPGESDVLRQAAEILKRRSKKPKGIRLSALVKVLVDAADKIDAPKEPWVPLRGPMVVPDPRGGPGCIRDL